MKITEEQKEAVSILLLAMESLVDLPKRYTCKKGSQIIGDQIRILASSEKLLESMKIVDMLFLEE